MVMLVRGVDIYIYRERGCNAVQRQFSAMEERKNPVDGCMWQCVAAAVAAGVLCMHVWACCCFFFYVSIQCLLSPLLCSFLLPVDGLDERKEKNNVEKLTLELLQ